MELSLNIKSSLKQCGNDLVLSTSNFKTIVDQIEQCVSYGLLEQLTLINKNMSNDTSKFLTSLCILVTEASRNNIESVILKSVLEELNWNADRISMILALYESKKSELRWKLSSCTTFPPQITDVNWKLDYISKDNTGTSAGSLSYMITFHIQIPNSESVPLTFKCNLAELTHLVTRLRQASRCVQKYAGKA